MVSEPFRTSPLFGYLTLEGSLRKASERFRDSNSGNKFGSGNFASRPLGISIPEARPAHVNISPSPLEIDVTSVGQMLGAPLFLFIMSKGETVVTFTQTPIELRYRGKIAHTERERPSQGPRLAFNYLHCDQQGTGTKYDAACREGDSSRT